MIFLLLFIEFLKTGLFSVGGGLATVPFLAAMGEKYGWFDEKLLSNMIAVGESTPGPIGVNMATFVGSEQAGILGSALASLGVVLPSFIIILLIAAILKNFIENKYFKGFIRGVKPVVIALISATGFVLLIKCIGFVPGGKFQLDLVSILCFALIAARAAPCYGFAES